MAAGGLLNSSQQTDISQQRRVSVNTSGADAVTAVTGEALQLYYYNASGVLTIDAGQAAGVVAIIKLANNNILNQAGDVMGSDNNTSFAFTTGTVFVTARKQKFKYLEAEKFDTATGAAKANAICAGFTNGDWTIDHENGIIYGKKATTGTTDTGAYKVLKSSVTATISGAGTSMTDDAAFTPGTTAFTPVGGIADETATDLVDEGDAGVFRMTLNRRQITAADKLDDSAFGIGTDYTSVAGFLADESATDSVDEGDTGAARMTLTRKIITADNFQEDGAHTSTDYGSFVLGVANVAQGTFGADNDYTPHAVDLQGNTMTVGNIAHDIADAGNPVKIGSKAITAEPTAVTANDRVNWQMDIYGHGITRGALREMKGNQKTTITSSASETTIVAADATYKLDLYQLIIANTSAVQATVTIKDATSGTTRFVFAIPAGTTTGFNVPIDSAHMQAAANNNWTATCTSVASIEITACFVKNL